MTPDHYGYTPCPTCGVLAPEGRPHPADFCERYRGTWLEPLCVRYVSPDDADELDDGLSTGPEPVTVDVDALWGGT